MGPRRRTSGRRLSLSELSNDYRTVPLSFKAEGTSENARLEITSKGSEAFRVGTVSLMPADNVEGFRPEVLKVLKELDAPVYRWPGGNFVSGYDWKDGLGDPDRRPPRKNPAWLGIEHNDVGIHEFLDFCRLIGTDPYITVNSGQGSETLAAEEVEYVNGAAGHAHGQMARPERPSATVERQVLVDRQRNVWKLAARTYAAPGLREKAQPLRPGDAGQGPDRSS